MNKQNSDYKKLLLKEQSRYKAIAMQSHKEGKEMGTAWRDAGKQKETVKSLKKVDKSNERVAKLIRLYAKNKDKENIEKQYSSLALTNIFYQYAAGIFQREKFHYNLKDGSLRANSGSVVMWIRDALDKIIENNNIEKLKDGELNSYLKSRLYYSVKIGLAELWIRNNNNISVDYNPQYLRECIVQYFDITNKETEPEEELSIDEIIAISKKRDGIDLSKSVVKTILFVLDKDADITFSPFDDSVQISQESIITSNDDGMSAEKWKVKQNIDGFIKLLLGKMKGVNIEGTVTKKQLLRYLTKEWPEQAIHNLNDFSLSDKEKEQIIDGIIELKGLQAKTKGKNYKQKAKTIGIFQEKGKNNLSAFYIKKKDGDIRSLYYQEIGKLFGVSHSAIYNNVLWVKKVIKKNEDIIADTFGYKIK